MLHWIGFRRQEVRLWEAFRSLRQIKRKPLFEIGKCAPVPLLRQIGRRHLLVYTWTISVFLHNRRCVPACFPPPISSFQCSRNDKFPRQGNHLQWDCGGFFSSEFNQTIFSWFQFIAKSSINPYWIKANNIWFFGWHTISQAFLTIPYVSYAASCLLFNLAGIHHSDAWFVCPVICEVEEPAIRGRGGPLWSRRCNLRLIDGNCHHFVQGWATLDWGTCTSRGKVTMHNACLCLPFEVCTL